MEKEKMEQCKARLVEAANWGRKQITPQRLKKGAGCLLALAIVAGGGKFAMHKAKAEAKIQEAQAKTRMLQNMAAQQNITLVSTDAVKENIASTLGTDPSTITFQSITLDDRKPGEKKEDRKDSKKEKKQERKASKKTIRPPGRIRTERGKPAGAAWTDWPVRSARQPGEPARTGRCPGTAAGRTAWTERCAGKPEGNPEPTWCHGPAGNAPSGNGQSGQGFPGSVSGPV